MIIGLLLIGLAVNFLLQPPVRDPSQYFPLDPTASLVCGGIVIFLGFLLLVSTYGRWRKARITRGA